MAGTLVSAIVIVIASVAVGRTLMLVLGWQRPEWVAGAAGFAALVVIAPFAVRLPGRGATAAVILALIVIVCAVVTRNATPKRSERSQGDHPATGRAQHLVALAVVPAVLFAACLPFVFNERTGVLGEGVYTNDQAAQLFWADWLADGFGPEPSAVRVGYPVGPQALAASVSEGTGFDLLDVFNGLLIAIPALTALAALSALAQLPPWRRGLAAALAGLPYLGASFLAQSGFKETTMAMLVLALGVVLRLATRREGEEREPPPVRSVVGVIAVLAAAAVFTFSIPGAVWFAVAIPVWAILSWGFGTSRIDLGRLRAEAAAHRGLLAGGTLALVALAVVALGPASAFIGKIGEVQDSNGRLSSPVFPGEAFGIWPEGDFRVVRGDVSGSLLASGFAALCILGGAVALLRKRECALLSTLVSAGFVYALARPFAEIHVEAKALAVLAPITMLVAVRWLLAPGRTDGDGADARGLSPRMGTVPRRAAFGRAALARQAVGAAFAAFAVASSFVALRAAPVGFDDRGEDDLRALAGEIDGGSVAFLGLDRFAGYWLRGTLAESPGGYVPRDVEARPEKAWQQGEAIDFDTLSPSKLDDYDYAITTAAGYQSTSPPSFTVADTAGDFVLWKRTGETPSDRVLNEGGDPGKIFDCSEIDLVSQATATTLETPVTSEQRFWEPAYILNAPASATATLDVPAGDWAISLQYHSQVPLTLSTGGQAVAELPPSLEGFYLSGAGRGAFWPAGELHSPGGQVEVQVRTGEPSGLQELLGVERTTWLGTLALTSKTAPGQTRLADACGDYVDHYAKP